MRPFSDVVRCLLKWQNIFDPISPRHLIKNSSIDCFMSYRYMVCSVFSSFLLVCQQGILKGRMHLTFFPWTCFPIQIPVPSCLSYYFSVSYQSFCESVFFFVSTSVYPSLFQAHKLSTVYRHLFVNSVVFPCLKWWPLWVFQSNEAQTPTSRKNVRWSAVPDAPWLVYDRCGDEKGSSPIGANDLCWARIWELMLELETPSWDWSIEAGIGASKLGLELRGLGLSFGAGIGALRLRLELWGLDWSLAAGIEALGMGLGFWGYNLGFGASRGERGRRRRRRRKSPICLEAWVIGAPSRPLPKSRK